MKKGNFKDIAGQKFYRLTAIKREGTTKHGESMWLCHCECGNKVVVRHGGLTSGNTKSCGCWNRENIKTVNKTHGDSYTRLYKIWTGLKKRCFYEHDKNYYLYGGRGITVCAEWKNDYSNFKKWALENGYTDNLSIDRKDSNGNYESENCKWSTLARQANNKRNNVLITVDGITHTMVEWCKLKNLSYRMVKTRHQAGWNDRDLFIPKGSKRQFPLVQN